jgi:hypothetical protein
MGTITRPNKIVGGNKDYQVGADILASEANNDINQVYDTINGGISAINIDPLAAIPGTCLAAKPNGVPQTRINDVSVGTPELIDGAATRAKVGLLAIDLARLDVKSLSNPGILSVAGFNGQSGLQWDTGLAWGTYLPICVQIDIPNTPGTPTLYATGIVKVSNQIRIQIWTNVSGIGTNLPANAVTIKYLQVG